MRSFFEEFKKFILRGNVVDLAIGIIIGTAFGKVVDSMVKEIFMPVIGVITGGFDVSGQTVTLYKDAKLGWGEFLQTIITRVDANDEIYKKILDDEDFRATLGEFYLRKVYERLREGV